MRIRCLRRSRGGDGGGYGPNVPDDNNSKRTSVNEETIQCRSHLKFKPFKTKNESRDVRLSYTDHV
jgi:hypothetical protein